MSADATRAALVGALVRDGRLFELSQEMSRLMPVHPSQPPFFLSLVRRHGDTWREEGYSAASELLVMCAHHGTHMDAPGHVSVDLQLHGGIDAQEAQRGVDGLKACDIASVAPLVTRGLVVDVARARGVDRLAPDEAVELDVVRRTLDAAGVAPRPGDALLIRTGQGALWGRPREYYPDDARQPGVDPRLAGWIVEQRMAAAGTDTMVFERTVAGQNRMPAHVTMLQGGGVPIMENLSLESIAAAGVVECLLVALPLRLVGATGSPVRAIALT